MPPSASSRSPRRPSFLRQRRPPAARAARRRPPRSSPRSRPQRREWPRRSPHRQQLRRWRDLDFHLDEGDRPAAPDRSAAKADKDASAAPALARPQAAIDLDKLDLAFGPDHATFDDPTPSVLDGQWHDAATKLDLAKAYQEMGDVEGAREILQEVLHEGDDTQKSEAQVLLAKLG